jgi:Fur family ferric uptake transcriptional regulator
MHTHTHDHPHVHQHVHQHDHGHDHPRERATPRQSKLAARNTRQRDAVVAALQEANAPVSAKQILTLASKHAEGMGLATVYRTLKLLIDAGEAQAVDIPGLTPLFELTGKGHHHHFVCTACERVFELEGACCMHFDDLAPKGFVTQAHELSLYGLCDACSSKAPQSSKHEPAKTQTKPAKTKRAGTTTSR